MAIFLYCLHKWWILKLKEHPMCKHQHVYRWQFFCLLSARVLDSQAKSSPTYKNQQVYRWQILRLRLHKCWILELKDHPSVKISKYTEGKLYYVYRLRNWSILKLKDFPSVKINSLPVTFFFSFLVRTRVGLSR